MDPVRCFLAVETERVALRLRRLVFSSYGACHGPGSGGHHEASVPIGDAPVVWDPQEGGMKFLALRPERLVIAPDDPRWPETCRFCAHRFMDHPENLYSQVDQDLFYRRLDTGEELLLRDMPVGAMWYSDWMGAPWVGPDGRTLAVMTPKHHEWIVDGHASNAPDKMRPGWTREGVPPDVTAWPSIQTPDWHGYLTRGFLQDTR